MAMSVDSDLVAIQPDILSLGIDSFSSEHAQAQADIQRRLRREWWPMTNRSGELKPAYLTESQFTKAAAYLVLWKYALPQLATWNSEDRFTKMIDFYKVCYKEEFSEVLQDGVEYDADDDGVITVDERTPTHFGRLTR